MFGVSGGGTLTGTIICRSDRFQAASPKNPLFNFFSVYGTSDLGMFVGHTSMGGPPFERAEAYHRSSPIFEAHRCTTPTLLLQHEGDHRSPPEQTEQFYAILKNQGVDAEMLRFPRHRPRRLTHRPPHPPPHPERSPPRLDAALRVTAIADTACVT